MYLSRMLWVVFLWCFVKVHMNIGNAQGGKYMKELKAVVNRLYKKKIQTQKMEPWRISLSSTS